VNYSKSFRSISNFIYLFIKKPNNHAKSKLDLSDCHNPSVPKLKHGIKIGHAGGPEEMYHKCMGCVDTSFPLGSVPELLVLHNLNSCTNVTNSHVQSTVSVMCYFQR
jgi:hypothetical protein